ncbi:unnamed protein product [Cyprideis torosa]|uniref:Uncharacterized protein n=1 Tax=Cyprideis torosa TaxID=163714 RepID=A0A7R8ZM04_9CRUS|nr:unnamed protein product [Cyprideis torosa]CAG0884792.1 unnamed protein product [Cyprideis torosa]
MSSIPSSATISSEPVIHKYSIDIEVPKEKNLHQLVEKGCLKDPKKVIFTQIDGEEEESLTGEDLSEGSAELGKALRKRGLKKGDKVTICMENHLHFPIIMLATLRNGAIVHLVNPGSVEVDISQQLKAAKPRFVFYSSKVTYSIQEIAPNLTSVDAAFLMNTKQLGLLLEEGKADKGNPPLVGGDSDPAFLVYSSGTTGNPKGILLSHRSLIFSVTSYKRLINLEPNDILLNILSFSHLGSTGVILSSLSTGSRMVFKSWVMNFDLADYIQILGKYHVNVLPMSPYIGLFFLKHPKVVNKELGNVKTVILGSAPVSAEMMKNLMNALPQANIIEGYGQAEAPLMTHCTLKGVWKPGSCGKVAPFYESKIVNPSGSLAEPGEQGLVHVRGPQIMNGYLNPEENNGQMVDSDGWLNTGDLGYYDEDGFYFIVDRSKEIIKWKDKQISPVELEHILNKHPAVLDAVVVAKQDTEDGQVPVAFVVKMSSHQDLKEEELRKFVDDQVEDWKKLRGGVRFVDSIPKTVTGKPRRGVMREKLVSQ